METSKGDWVRSAMSEYERPLIRYAAYITGDLERAREVVQDTFLKLCFQAPGQIDDHLAQWLYTVCRNGALDVQRKEQKIVGISQAKLESEVQPGAEPSAILERKEQLSEVLKILEALPANQQETLRLKFQGDLSYSEISRITNISVSNVGFLIHTGLAAIREKIRAQSSPRVVRRVK
jgi:RNA polymerase sigma factor (sigma-70 family)